jgi:hypothetical protein
VPRVLPSVTFEPAARRRNGPCAPHECDEVEVVLPVLQVHQCLDPRVAIGFSGCAVSASRTGMTMKRNVSRRVMEMLET